MSSLKCPYCPRTFTNKSGYTQHVNNCVPPPDSDSEEEIDLMTNINDMSLDGDEFAHNIREVKKFTK